MRLQVAFNLYAFFKEGGALPESGGMNDQSATWVAAVQVFQRVLGELEKLSLEKMKSRKS